MSSKAQASRPATGAGHYAEDELLPVSGLSHMVFCPRRWALIHLEGLWADNRHTAEGRDLHGAVHADGAERKGEVVIVRSLRLRSLALGLVGMSDVVEFHPLTAEEGAAGGCALPGRAGPWRPVPVEHKRGRPQPDDCYHVQLAGQALCLEEMTGATVPLGYLFHAAPRRRQEVRIDQALRQRTKQLAVAMHVMRADGNTPPAKYHKKCRGCSLLDLCQPKTVGRGKSAGRYLVSGLASLKKEED